MFIGIDIGGTKCAVIKGDEKLNILEKVKFATGGVDETLDRILAEVERLMPCEAIGISCGGPLDENNGVIMSPPNLPGWDDIHITKILTERFRVPAYLCNDANACALAEWRFGAGKGTENMIFMTFGTGLGAGLILNGKLYTGSNGNAGEIGHIRLADDGPLGYGKNGSFEGFCSGGGIAQLAKSYALERLNTGKSVGFCENISEIENITTKSVAECANLGDSDAIHIFEKSAEKLGMGLSVLIDILNPQAIVIGSVFARSENLFVNKMNEVLDREALQFSRNVCRILPASLGENIGDIAALTVALEGKNDHK